MEKNEVKIFSNEEFGDVRTVNIDGEPWFVGRDVATALGYQNGSRDINRHVVEEDRQNYQNGTFESPRGMTVINESGMYALIFGSRLESARRFKHWVTNEVLPSVRKYGGYIDGQEKMSDEELVAKALMIDQKQIEEKDSLIQEKEKQLVEQKPLVDFALQVSQGSDTIDMEEMAKVLNDENIRIGRNRLIRWLKQSGILKENRMPYQEYINRGYFDVAEVKKDTAYGTRVFPKTVITGKGQVWIMGKLREKYRAA